jgi:cytoskeleton protein RodZ
MARDFGTQLKEQRLERGIGLDVVSTSTKISLRYLMALESNRFGDLPGGVFNRGIVRSYARVIGLDEGRQVEEYLQASGEIVQSEADAEWVEFAQNVSKNRGVSRRSNPWVGVVGMFAGLAGLATVVWVVVVHHF